MSEFRQASARVSELEAALALLRQGVEADTTDESVEETLRSMLDALNSDTSDMMDKFRARCVMVDPVTQQPRFGPKMMAKVQDMLQRYDNVATALEVDAPLRLQAEAKVKVFAAAKLEAERRQSKRLIETREAERAAELARKQEQERVQLEAQRREAEKQRQEQERVDALAAAAKKKREERERGRLEDEKRRAQQEEERKRLNASIPRGKKGLEQAIAMLKESTGSTTVFRQSLEKLLAVVTNICASPENAAFRHIPRDNAHFHADLGQYNGGHQCLLALGFQELQQGDDSEPKFVFVLEEPDLSEDLDAWSDWFDGLKAMKELVLAKL